MKLHNCVDNKGKLFKGLILKSVFVDLLLSLFIEP